MKKLLKTEPLVAESVLPIEREFVDVATAAGWTCASKATIRRMLTAGELTRYKFGSRTLIKIAELRSHVKADVS